MRQKKMIIWGFILMIILSLPVYAHWSFDIAIKKVEDNTSDTQITYSDIIAGSDTWKVADQYIEINIDCNLLDWGVQMYTDNKGTGADPLYTGTADDPGGLVGLIHPSTYIPLAFSVKGSTEVVIAPDPEPGEGVGEEFYNNHCWKWMSDYSRVNPVWEDDNSYVRVWDENGIYWHESDTEPYNPAWNDSPNLVYLAGRFHQSTAQQYKTSKLILELYSLDDSLVYGILCDSYKYSALKADVLNPPDPDGGYIGFWGTIEMVGDDTIYTEAPASSKFTITGGWGGIWIQFGFDGIGGPSVETDMSEYSDAYLKFDVKASNDFGVSVEWTDTLGRLDSAEKYVYADLGVPLDDAWHSVAIDLSTLVGKTYGLPINFSKIKLPFSMFADGGSGITFWIDNVRWEE